jgi:hypothetical protein
VRRGDEGEEGDEARDLTWAADKAAMSDRAPAPAEPVPVPGPSAC